MKKQFCVRLSQQAYQQLEMAAKKIFTINLSQIRKKFMKNLSRQSVGLNSKRLNFSRN